MAPRKAGKTENVAPQRSSTRLRLRKQQDPSHIEEETSSNSEKLVENESPHSSIHRLRRKRQENVPQVTGQDCSSSKTLIEFRSDTKATALTSASIGPRELTEAEENEREVLDPAWRQFKDPTIEPTSTHTDQSLPFEGSGRRSPLSEKAPDSAGRLDQGDQLLTPSSTQERLSGDRVHIANDTEFATIRQWMQKTQTRWKFVSRTGFQVAQETYRNSRSTHPMLEPGGRGDPLAPFKGIVVRVLGILAALVLFLSIVTVPLKGFDTDLNNASMSSSKAVSLDKCAGTRWSKVNFLSPDPGRQSDGGSAEQVPPENQILSGDMVDSRRSIKCTVLQRLYYHKRTCPWFRNVDNPLAGDEAAISKSRWEGTKRLHNQICERLQNVPTDVVTYYLEVRANMTDLYKHARYIQNVTREGTTQPPRGQSADATEAPPIVMAQIVPVWQMRLASLNTLATPLKLTLIDLQVDLSALKYKLNSARKGAVLPGPEVVESLSWPRWAAGWTDMSKPENKPVSAHTKAIALIDKWFAETSALNYVVSEVYFELEDLDMTIRDVVRKRLTSDGPYPWSSAESFDDLDNAKRDIVRKGLISADSLELKLFLTRISQEIRRLYNSAQSSKSMQGWGEAEGSKGADGSGKSDVGDDSELEWRTAPLV